MRLWVVVVIALCSCGKGEQDAGPKGAPGSAGSGSAVATPPAGSGSAVAAGSARSPKIAAAKCGEPCLFLLDTPIAQLADAYKTACGGMETKNLGFDDCKQLDYVRNCVYAAHGLVYKKKWKKVFEAKPWYEPRADVRAKTIAMSEVEHANVHELYLRGKACKKNLKISGADYERIKAWFAALPKPPVPKFVFAWNNYGDNEPETLPPVDGKGLVTFLDDDTTEVKSKVRSGKEISGSYEEPATLAKETKLLEPIHVTDPSKLRSIRLDIELGHGTEDEPYTDSFTLHFIYDDKDQLVAMTAERITFD